MNGERRERSAVPLLDRVQSIRWRHAVIAAVVLPEYVERTVATNRGTVPPDEDDHNG